MARRYQACFAFGRRAWPGTTKRALPSVAGHGPALPGGLCLRSPGMARHYQASFAFGSAGPCPAAFGAYGRAVSTLFAFSLRDGMLRRAVLADTVRAAPIITIPGGGI